MSVNIIEAWEQEQLNNLRQPLFFTVKFRTILTDWQYFKGAPQEHKSTSFLRFGYSSIFEPGERLSFTTLDMAQDLASEQSVAYINSLVGVFVGDSNIILALWDDGKCVYDNPLNIMMDKGHFLSF